MVFEGDEHAGAWWPVAEFAHDVPVRIGPDPAVESVSNDAGAAAWLARLRGVLQWERGPGPARSWPVGVKIGFPREDGGWPDGFTFGGPVALEVLWSGREEYEPLAWTDSAWWALRDDRDRHGARLIDGRNQWVGFEHGPPAYESSMAWPGEGERLVGARLVIHPSERAVGDAFTARWDLDAVRVWERPLYVELTDWERQRLERWMLEGWD